MKKEEGKIDETLEKPEVCEKSTQKQREDRIHFYLRGSTQRGTARWGNATYCEPSLTEVVYNAQDGVVVHGLFMEAMKWDDETMAVVDSRPGEMNPVSKFHLCFSILALHYHLLGS